MINDIKISIVQTTLFWEEVDKNLENFTSIISGLKNKTDLVVLPEMFSTGFSMNSKKLAETINGKSVKWMIKTSKENNVSLVGSLIITENDKYYNKLLFVTPNGKISEYNKRHLFRMANEHNYYSAGDKELIVEFKGWRIKPLVCYDLRFPVWARNKNNYDILIYIANWPERRSYAWKTLLRARAIENQAYVIGVNRIGTDQNNVIYSGDSAIVNPYGEEISNIKPHENKIQTIEISYKKLFGFRESFPVGLDADRFVIEL